MKTRPQYLDSASTTPVDNRVLKKMLPFFTDLFANASSNHEYGKKAKRAIEDARQEIANLIGADKRDLFFTSGATESINWALKGYLSANKNKGNHIITVRTEHKAVLKTCEYLEDIGYEVTYLNVDTNGLIEIEDLKNEIKEQTALICVMFVNNETGVIQNIPAISEIAAANDICFLCDGTQAVGKVPLDVADLNIDMMCFSAHKLGGPKGVGALFLKNHIKIDPLIHGGSQEKELRGGTYNTPLIAGFGEACRILNEELEKRINEMLEQRKTWESKIESTGVGIVNFKEAKRAPHILSVTLNTFEGDQYLNVNSNNFIASTGSACNARVPDVSHVLKAIGVSKPENVIRLSFS